MADRDIEDPVDRYVRITRGPDVDSDKNWLNTLDDPGPLADDDNLDELRCPNPHCRDGWIRTSDPTSSAWFPKPDRVYRCSDCKQETP